MKAAFYLFACMAFPAAVLRAAPKVQSFDVVVYSNSSAGATAAIEARRQGASVILLETGKRVGGMTTNGLGATDVSSVTAKRVVGGLAREFYQRIFAYYQNASNWKHGSFAEYQTYKYWGYLSVVDGDSMWTFEPHVALETFQAMLKENNVPVVLDARLDPRGIEKNGNAITAVRTNNGDVYQGKVFIDASYEGDLMAAAGVTSRVGREANSEYDEKLNGVHHFTGTMPRVEPWKIAGNSKSGLLPFISADAPGAEGSADHSVMAYCYRLCLTDVPENRVPFPKPANYNPGDYELLLRYIQAGATRVFGNHVWMPNHKTDMNNGDSWFSLDFIGGSKDYPLADAAKRAQIVQRHRDYEQGFLWFLANDPRVPDSIRSEVRKFGLPKDEFTENANWPTQLYVREARRMVGEYVMTENDCRHLRDVGDPVAFAGNGMDSHITNRFVGENGMVAIEGNFGHPIYPFGISYRSLTPKEAECANLLVPVCLSATHASYGSIRMEPVFMELGQAAGAAATVALKRKSTVQAAPYAELRAILDKEKAVLPTLPECKAVVLDDEQAEFTGDWKLNTSGTYVGSGFHTSNATGTPSEVRFNINVPQSGNYEVRLYYRDSKDFAKSARAMILHGDQKTEHSVDFTKYPSDGVSISLGTYLFETNTANSISLSTADADGPISIDAVTLFPQ